MSETTTKSKPTVSVIMGIYNCENTLCDAVNCIIAQTFTDWELIMCDDGSADGTYEKAVELKYTYPDRIILLKNEKNMGLNHTLNRCLKSASGRYIARMDGDDLCSPDRFEKELYVLENKPEIAIVSTDMEFFDENGVWGSIAYPEYPTAYDFLPGSPFCHAPCMVRREAYEAVNGYTESPKLLRVEDYHLWMKMYKLGYRGMNIHEALYQMRDDRNAYRRRKLKSRINEAYVKCLIVRELKLPVFGYVYTLRPLLVGLLPHFLYDAIRKRNLKIRDD